MEEDFVTFEQALRLKEMGFNWECNHFYESNTLTPSFELISNDGGVAYKLSVDDLTCNFNLDNIDSTWVVSAPTLSQTQKWLRKVKKTEVIVIRLDDDVYSYTIYGEIVNVTTESTFDTYEDALSEGIDGAFELLK